MRLTDAGVDLAGRTVARGRLTIPPTDEGRQLVIAHDAVTLAVPDLLSSSSSAAIEVCTATRDGKGGFFALPPASCDSANVRLTVPPSLLGPLLEVLRFGGACSVSYDGGSGALTWDGPGNLGSSSLQLLTDYRMAARTREDGACVVNISAALYGEASRPGFRHVEVRNYWRAEHGAPQRLTTDFIVDLPTRVALFGSYFPQSSPAIVIESQIDTTPDSAGRPELSKAMVYRPGSFGPHGYGIAPDGSLYEYSLSPLTGVGMRRCRNVGRDANGMVVTHWRDDWIYLKALQLVDFRDIDVELRRGSAGQVGRNEPGIGWTPIERAAFKMSVCRDGVHVAFDVQAKGEHPGARADSFRVPWANIVMHGSFLLKHARIELAAAA